MALREGISSAGSQFAPGKGVLASGGENLPMNYCGKCNAVVEEGSSFCKACGTPVGSPSVGASQVGVQDTGMSANVAGLLTSILSFATFGIVGLAMAGLGLIIALFIFLYWLFLMYKAYRNERYKIPYIGDLAAKQAG